SLLRRHLPEDTHMLDMRQVTKVYRTELVETHALRSLDLQVREGEFVAVTGPSGSGKTTFLNIAGLLETFTGGEYRLDGVDVKDLDDNQRSRLRNEKIGFIFQSFNLIPDLNLFDNCDVPLRYRGMPAAERKLRIEDALGLVGLGSRMKHYPAELSGGQQQRAAIARALAGSPRGPPTTRNWRRARGATCTSSAAWRRICRWNRGCRERVNRNERRQRALRPASPHPHPALRATFSRRGKDIRSHRCSPTTSTSP